MKYWYDDERKKECIDSPQFLIRRIMDVNNCAWLYYWLQYTRILAETTHVQIAYALAVWGTLSFYKY